MRSNVVMKSLCARSSLGMVVGSMGGVIGQFGFGDSGGKVVAQRFRAGIMVGRFLIVCAWGSWYWVLGPNQLHPCVFSCSQDSSVAMKSLHWFSACVCVLGAVSGFRGREVGLGSRGWKGGDWAEKFRNCVKD